MEIPDIGTSSIRIRTVDIPGWTFNDPSSITVSPPVTVNIGFPIVDIPGCVEARETDDLRQVDPRGNMIFCDGNVPSFNPIQFEPNQKLPTPVPEVDTRQPKTTPIDELPIPKTPPATAVVECPTAAQQAKEPIGTYIEGFRKKVTDYELIGNQCVQITEPVPIPEQIIAGLPSAGSVVMTGGIAVIATTSALIAKPLADVLLKVIKPTVKKVMKKVAAIRGKTPQVLSTAERRNEQRDRNRAIMTLRQTLKPK